MQQLKLFKDTQRKTHGGSLIKGQRISTRPLSNQKPIHLILKSNPEFNLRKHQKTVDSLSSQYAQKNNIKIYSSSVQRDHIHYCLRISSKEEYKKFIRSLTGMLSRKIGKGLWKHRPFTRIGSWGRDFKGIQKYIEQNEMEAQGTIPYQPRRK